MILMFRVRVACLLCASVLYEVEAVVAVGCRYYVVECWQVAAMVVGWLVGCVCIQV